MLQPQPIIATEADTGINAFNLGQPFFTKVLAKVINGIIMILIGCRLSTDYQNHKLE